MTRKRMIDPGIWQNEQLGALPREGRLLFIGMFSNADDEGRLKASAAYLKAIVFPYDDDLPIKRIEELKQQIAAQGLIALYRSAGQEYLWLPTWDRYQKIKNPAPSQLPAPSEGIPPPVEQPTGRSGDQNPGRPATNGEALPERYSSNGAGLPDDPSSPGAGITQRSPSARETLPEPSGSDGVGLPQDSPTAGVGLLQHSPSARETLPEPSGSDGVGLPQASPTAGAGLLQRSLSARETLPKSSGSNGVGLPQDSPSPGVGLPPRLEEVRGSKERLGECRLVEGKGSGETVPGPAQPPADGIQPPASSSPSDSPGQALVPDASPGERQCLKLLRGLSHWPFDFQKDLAYLRQLSVEFPSVDMLREVSDFATHAMDKPIKNRGSPRLRLRHWIEKGAQFAEERRQQNGRGRETGRGLSQPGRPPEKAPRQPIQPIESGPDEGIAGVAGRGRAEPVQPTDTS